MGKSSVWLGGVFFLFACQPPSGQAPVVKPSVVSPSPVVSPLPSASGSLVSTPSPIQSLDKGPSSRSVEVVAGTGAKGFQDGPAKQATFNSVQGLCVHPKSGDIYILDTHKIRKLSQDGQVSTVVGSEEAGFQDGLLSEARFNTPQSCDFDDKGNLFVNDKRNFRIRQISTDNQVSTILGNGEALSKDGSQSEARLSYADNLLVTSAGKIYFTEGYKLRVFFEGKVITLNAHQQSLEHMQTYRDGAIQKQATFGDILDLSKNSKNEIFVGDVGTRSIRKIDINNQVSTLSKRNLESEWTYIRVPAGLAYFEDRNIYYISELSYINKMDAEGNVFPVATNFWAVEQNLPLPFSSIKDIVIQNGFLIINDYGSNQIKRMKL